MGASTTSTISGAVSEPSDATALKKRIKRLEKEVEALKRRQHEHFIPAYPIYPIYPFVYRRYWPEWQWSGTSGTTIQYTNTLSLGNDTNLAE